MTSDSAVLCCPDKFRGTLTAREAAAALATGVRRVGRQAIELALRGERSLARVDFHLRHADGPIVIA